MELKESKLINTDKATVWNALMSPDVLLKCIPGCKEMTGDPENGFEATVVQKVGPVKATFKGQVTKRKKYALSGIFTKKYNC